MEEIFKLNEKALSDLRTRLENDLPMLRSEERYQKHEPAYYDYVTYCDDVAASFLALAPESSGSVIGAYLFGLFFYQILDMQKTLAEAVETVIKALDDRLTTQRGDAKQSSQASNKA